MIPLVALTLALAAPVPKTTAKTLQEVYGEIVDPDSRCKCELTKDGGLRVTVPKEHPAIEAVHGQTVVPPMLRRKVEGDFVLTTRITLSFDPAAGMAEGAKRGATVAGGVAFTAADPKAGLTLVHTLKKNGDKWDIGRFMQVRLPTGGGSGSGQGDGVPDGKTTFMRLTRTGHELKAEYSGDGKKYFLFAKHKVDGLGDVLQVGPVAFQSTTADFEAVFDQYEIKSLTVEKK